MKDTIDMARAIWVSGTGIYEGPNIGQLKAFEAIVRADERNRVWSQKHWTEYEQAIVQAEREACASDKIDAERYRHMRNNAQFQSRNGPGLYWYLPRFRYGKVHDEGKQLDDAIDAAIRERGETK